MGDAKLERPPDLAAPEKPLPSALNPEPPEADAKPDIPVAEGFKTDGDDADRVPKGDLSEPAKTAREEDANAEVEAGLFGDEGSLDCGGAASEANGEVADVLANALAAKP